MASSAAPRENEVIGVSRKIEDQEYVEASTSAATVLPGVPLPAWSYLGEPEPEPTPEPAPEPVSVPSSVMELVSVGAGLDNHAYGQGEVRDLASGVPELAAPVPAPPAPAPPVPAPLPAPPAPSAEVAPSLISVVGTTVPGSIDAFAPPVAPTSTVPVLAPPLPVAPMPAPVVPAQPAPSFAAPVPVLEPPAPPAPAPQSLAFAPPVVAPVPEVPVLAPADATPELLAPAPELPAPVAVAAAPLLFSTPAPVAAPAESAPAVAPEAPSGAASFADPATVPALEAVVPESAPVFDPAAELGAAHSADSDTDADDKPTRSRRPLVLLLVLAMVAILAAVAAFVYPGLLVTQDAPAPVAPVSQPQVAAKTATLGVPATVAGLDKLSGAPATALSAAAGSTTLSGFSTPVSAVYGKAGVPSATVIAWTAAPSSPSANIASAFAGFETASSTAIANIADVPVTGGLTGQMSCGSGTVNAAPATVCFWADDTTFGAITVLKPASAKDGALTAVAVRQGVETLA